MRSMMALPSVASSAVYWPFPRCSMAMRRVQVDGAPAASRCDGMREWMVMLISVRMETAPER